MATQSISIIDPVTSSDRWKKADQAERSRIVGELSVWGENRISDPAVLTDYRAQIDALWRETDPRSAMGKTVDFVVDAVGSGLQSIPDGALAATRIAVEGVGELGNRVLPSDGFMADNPAESLRELPSVDRFAGGAAQFVEGVGTLYRRLAPEWAGGASEKYDALDEALEGLRGELPNAPKGVRDFLLTGATKDEKSIKWLGQWNNRIATATREFFGKGSTTPNIRMDERSLIDPDNRDLLAEFVMTRNPNAFDAYAGRVKTSDKRLENRQDFTQPSTVNPASTWWERWNARAENFQGSFTDVVSTALPFLSGLKAGKAVAAAAAEGAAKKGLGASVKSLAFGVGEEGVQGAVQQIGDNPMASFGEFAQAAGQEAIGGGVISLAGQGVGFASGKLADRLKPDDRGSGSPTSTTTTAGSAAPAAPTPSTLAGIAADGGRTPVSSPAAAPGATDAEQYGPKPSDAATDAANAGGGPATQGSPSGSETEVEEQPAPSPQPDPSEVSPEETPATEEPNDQIEGGEPPSSPEVEGTAPPVQDNSTVDSSAASDDQGSGNAGVAQGQSSGFVNHGSGVQIPPPAPAPAPAPSPAPAPAPSAPAPAPSPAPAPAPSAPAPAPSPAPAPAPSPAPAPAPKPKKPKPERPALGGDGGKSMGEAFGAGNKVVTREDMDKVRAELRKKLGQFNAGIDPEIAVLGVKAAAFYIEGGVRKFADYVKAMIDDFGEGVRPYLKGWYLGAKYYPGIDPTGMDSETDIAKYESDAEAAGKKGTSEIDSAHPGVAIADEVYSRLMEGGIVTAKDVADLASRAGLDEKQGQEWAEAGIVAAARAIYSENEGDLRAAFDGLVDLYKRQPNLTIRTLTSKVNQAYSTPPPLAMFAGIMSGLPDATTIVEPTAGNGMLLFTASPEAEINANEIDPDRRRRLAHVGGGAISVSDLDASTAEWHEINASVQPDAIVANPPFGSLFDEGGKIKFPVLNSTSGVKETPSIDLAIALNTLDGMAPNGKAVIIIGAKTGSPGATMASDPAKRAAAYERPILLDFFKKFNVTDWFTMSGDLYAKMGAGWPVDVIVIDGKHPTPSMKSGGTARPWVTPPRVVTTWDELAEMLPGGKLHHGHASSSGGSGGSGTGGKPPGGGGGTGSGGGPPSGPAPSERDGAGDSDPDGTGHDSDSTGDHPGGKSGGAGDGGDVSGSADDAGGSGTGAAEPGASGVDSDDSIDGESKPDDAHVVDYVPVSKNGNPALKAPKNIAEAQRQALLDLEAEVGMEVDDYVASKTGVPVENLRKGLNAAQLDAAALAIRNIERGSALINSDQTGVGKGRVVAAIIGLYAKKRNLIPVFVTAKKNLYEDMVGRDLPAIGVTDFKPLISDATVEYEDGRGEMVKRVGKSQQPEFQRIVVTGKLEGYDGIFTTYDQLKSDYPDGFKETKAAKASRVSRFETKPPGWRWEALKVIAPYSIFILDEAHEAAGGTSENFLHFAETLPGAAGVYFSSATYAKRPDNLGLYAMANLIRRAGLNIRKIADFFAAGGVPLQQALTSMLAAAGEFIRREQNWSGVKFDFKRSSADPEREIELANTYTAFLQNLMKLSAQVAKAASGLADAENMYRPKEERINLESVNFGSKLFNLSQQYLLALRSGAIVSETLRLLKEGKKPFIALANTMEGPIQTLIAEGLPVNFNGILLRQLKGMLVLKERHGREVTERILDPTDLPDGGAFYRSLEARIRAAEFGDMPISPWDYIRGELSKHGVTSAEIAGRQSTLGESEEGEPVLSKKEKAERNAILQSYNDGVTDVLIVNQAGSTGLSAHADPRFKDQRQRAMIVGQAAPDINVFMQMLGRVMRFGQTSVPEYIILQSALAAETRFMTMLRRKLASLNANTTADTESGLTANEDFAPDVFNPVGDEVVAEVMMGSPHILRAIGIPSVAEGEVPEDFARKVTGRLVLLPNEQADEIWSNIADAFNEKVAYLDSIGQNPLKATALDLEAETVEATVMVDGDGNTPFDGDVVVEKVKIKPQRKPLSYDETAAQAERMAEEYEANYRAWLDAGVAMEAEVMKALGEDPESTPEMIAAIKSRFALARTQAANIHSAIADGEVWGIDPNVEDSSDGRAPVFYGRPVAVRFGTKAQSDFTALSRIRVVMAVNTPQRAVTAPVSKLPKMIVSEVAYHERAGRFNVAADIDQFRYIVTGNLLRGFDHVKAARGRAGTAPRVAIYTLKGGGSRVGILMPPGWSGATSKIVPVKDGTDAREHLDAGRKMVGDFGIEITATGYGTAMRIQSVNTVKHIWGDRRFGEFFKAAPVERRGHYFGTLADDSIAGFDDLIDFLRSKGVTLTAVLEGMARELKVAKPSPKPAAAPGQAPAAPAPAPAPKVMSRPELTDLLRQILPPHIADRIELFTDFNSDTVASLSPNGGIKLNSAKIDSAEAATDAVEHELLHFVWHDPGVQDAWHHVLASMDQGTTQRFVDEMTELGYDRQSMPEEAAVRWAHELAKMAKPGVWVRLVNAIKTAFHHGIGYGITTFRAQRAAVRLLAAGVNRYGSGIAVPQGAATRHLIYRGGPYRLSKSSRAIEAFITGSQLPADMRAEVENSKIATDALRDSAARVAGDLAAALGHYSKVARVPIDRANDLARDALQDPTVMATISGARWPALLNALTAARNMLDQMSDAIAQHVGGPGTALGDTILDNLGQWTRRSYAVFDKEANWNYDSLSKAAQQGDAEKQTILDNARAYIQAANPMLRNDEVTSIMREITDERIVSEVILPSGKHVSPNVTSLVRRKVIPAEIRALMGEQNNPIKIFTQSAAWQSQFLARIEHQKAVREIGLKSGIFSTSRGGPNGVYSHQIPDDNRFIELGGLWTTAEFFSALSEMYVDNAQSLVLKAAKLYAYIGGVSKLRKTAENPDGWMVNIIGGLVGITQNGGVFNPVALAKQFYDAAALVASGRTLSAEHYNAAGAALVYAKRQFLSELSAAGVASSAYSIQDIDGSIDADLTRAIERFDALDRVAGAVSGALLLQGFGREGGLAGRAVGAAAGAALGAWKGQAWLTRKERAIAHWFLGKPDNLFKIMAFLDNYRAHLSGGMGRGAAFDLAVEKTRNTMPDYAHLPNPLRQLSKLGVLGSFIAFKFEVYRNSYWNARYAAQEIRAGLAGNGSMLLRGMRRMMGLAAVYGAAPLLGTTLMGLGLGMKQGDDEKEHAYRRALTPAWDRFGVLHFTKLDGRTASYFNAGYLVPQTALWELISAGAEGRSITDAMGKIAEATAQQFAGGSVFLDPILEAVTNYREGTSRKISFEEGALGAAERAIYAADRALSPGAADKIGRIWRAERGESGPDGRKFTGEEEVLRLLGVRQGTYGHDRRIEYKMREFDGRWHDAWETAKAPLRQGRLGSVADAVKSANARIKEIAGEYRQWERDIHRIGVGQERLASIRRNAKGIRKTFPTLLYNREAKKIEPVDADE